MDAQVKNNIIDSDNTVNEIFLINHHGEALLGFLGESMCMLNGRLNMVNDLFYQNNLYVTL